MHAHNLHGMLPAALSAHCQVNAVQLGCFGPCSAPPRQPLTLPAAQLLSSIAVREAIKLCAAARAVDMYSAISAELAAVRQHYEQLRRAPPRSALQPAFGARALAAGRLLTRIQTVWAAHEVQL